MVQQSEGKMFLASDRGRSEQDWFRSYHTFNFGMYHQAHKKPFGPLYVLNDDTLTGGSHFIHFVEEASYVVVLPTVGAIVYSDSAGNKMVAEAGEALMRTVPKGTTFELSNPYEQERISFIQLWFKHPHDKETFSKVHHCCFDLDKNKNGLIPLLASQPGAALQHAGVHKIEIGMFSGRQEVMYTTAKPENGVFVFVLEGAFEVQYRMLERRDGLCLWDIREIEIEAHSEDAILLIIELALTERAITGFC